MSLSEISLSLRDVHIGLVGEEHTSPHIAEEAMSVALRLGSGTCVVHLHLSNLFRSGIDYDTCRDDDGVLKAYFIHAIWTGFILIGFCLFIVIWDIGHAGLLQILACKEPL
jgi:hypothetical protein